MVMDAKPYAGRGLDAGQVERSRRKHGSNSLTKRKRNSFGRQFLQSFGDPIIKILLAALAINVLFLFRNADWFETAGIAAAVFLATFVSTLSEYGSESAFEKLQADAANVTCRVRRSGRVMEVPAADIVVGDLVLLQAGERVPADGFLVEGSLHVDQSALNGESKEAAKTAGEGQPSDLENFLSKGGLFRGSVVCSGEGLMLVKRVGDRTFYGRMAVEVQEETRESPLKVRLGHLAKILSRIGYAAAVAVFFADFFHAVYIDNGMTLAGMMQEFSRPGALFSHLLHAATLAITVVVVAVPEGLPMMITVVLSSNMRRMLKDHVLVRKLVGIETSGSLNILFTDKTGTLTRGRLEVKTFIDGSGREYESPAALQKQKGLWELTALSAVYNSGSSYTGKKAIGGNATDRALLEYAAKGPVPKGYSRAAQVPFDSARKFSAAEVRGPRTLWLVKGAPEKLLPTCVACFDGEGHTQPFGRRTRILQRMDALTGAAVRMLALAVSDRPVDENGNFAGLTLIGLVGIRDEVRPEARAAIRQVHAAGVQVVMITGDNKQTAAAIARETGLITGKEKEQAVYTNEELARLEDSELKQRLPYIRVVARALPSDKSRLVRLAQECGLVAGMTGDGINDAPALKKADVGFAMGNGTEIAKEAGDIVILDDNFASISKAILYGRTIFKSIRKFIVFQLTMNLCAVGVSIIGPFIGVDTPVTVIQMLWINIIMDTLAGLAFAGEPPLPDYMNEPPKKRDEPIINRYMYHQIVCTGLFTVGLCLLFLKLPFFNHMFGYERRPAYFMSAFFALFIFAGIFNSFNARTHRLNLLAHLPKNKAFIGIMGTVAVVQILLIYWGGSLFRAYPLQPKDLLSIILLAALVIPADIIRKLILHVFHRKGNI